MARTSLVLGITAFICLLIPENTLILVIPLGILAIVYGKLAIKNGTSKESLAGMGKGLGMGVLIGFAREILIAVFLIALWYNWI